MLDIVFFALTFSPANLPMPPSINKVKSVAMSNLDGVTPNHLLPQMYGTTVLDEDVDLELSDEELELIAGVVRRGGNVNSQYSDIFYQGHLIVDYNSFVQFMYRERDGWKQIDYICHQFRGLLDCNPQSNDRNVIAAEIWQQIRDPTAVLVKRAHYGFTVDIRTGKLTYNR